MRVAGRVDAAVGIETAAVEQRPDPARFVELLAVGGIAGVDHEVHGHLAVLPRTDRTGVGEGVDLTDHRVVDLRFHRLPRSPGGVQRWPDRIDRLDPGGAFLVGELEVGELTDEGEGAAIGGAARLRLSKPLFAHRVALSRTGLEQPVAVAVAGRNDAGVDGGGAERIARRAFGGGGGGDRGRDKCDADRRDDRAGLPNPAHLPIPEPNLADPDGLVRKLRTPNPLRRGPDPRRSAPSGSRPCGSGAARGRGEPPPGRGSSSPR